MNRKEITIQKLLFLQESIKVDTRELICTNLKIEVERKFIILQCSV